MKLLLEQTNTRTLPVDYEGDVLLWDIDKTYLSTHFSSWRGLIGIPFEFAVDKESVPGSVPVIRALRRGVEEETGIVPLYFVSGSPKEMRTVIERRMTLDGVDFDGITFKDQLGLLLKGRPRALKEQIGYKLTALLLYWEQLPKRSRWLLFGDDVECDAEVFELFGRVCEGFRHAELEAHLRKKRVAKQDIRNLMELTERLTIGPNPIEKIFIHLERDSDPAVFRYERVVPTRSYLQTVLVLCKIGRVRTSAVSTVARELRLRGIPEDTIQKQLEDTTKRLCVDQCLITLANPPRP